MRSNSSRYLSVEFLYNDYLGLGTYLLLQLQDYAR